MGPKKIPKRKIGESFNENDDDIDILEEAKEEGINLDDEEENIESEGSGEDLMEELEK